MRDWQLNNKRRSLIFPYAANVNCSLMGYDDRFGDGKAKSGFARFAATGLVGAVEAVEDVGQVFGGNAVACV